MSLRHPVQCTYTQSADTALLKVSALCVYVYIYVSICIYMYIYNNREKAYIQMNQYK